MNKHDWGLVNQKYAAIKQEQTDLMAEMREDLEFYRKRIYQATKDLIKNDFDPKQSSIKNAFINYARLLVDHFKLEDIKELMSEQLDTIVEVEEEQEAHNESLTSDEITKQFLVRGEKPSIIRIEDCFNIIKKTTAEEIKPKKKQQVKPPSINIRQEKFREKGVKKRAVNKVLQVENNNLQVENIKNEPIIYETDTQEQADSSQENN